MRRLRLWLRSNITDRRVRRVMVAVIGGTVLLIGIAMVVLPGPALVVIPVGLGILGLEFAWARIWLRKVRARAQSLVGAARGRRDPV
ncbi:MAG: PGPGW domain-containing protein [Steroidobacteraceae bacterium]